MAKDLELRARVLRMRDALETFRKSGAPTPDMVELDSLLSRKKDYLDNRNHFASLIAEGFKNPHLEANKKIVSFLSQAWDKDEIEGGILFRLLNEDKVVPATFKLIEDHAEQLQNYVGKVLLKNSLKDAKAPKELIALFE